jgi:hypothetical protein
LPRRRVKQSTPQLARGGEASEVDDGLIRIIGVKSTLEQLVAGRAIASSGVRSFACRWRAISLEN